MFQRVLVGLLWRSGQKKPIPPYDYRFARDNVNQHHYEFFLSL